MKVRLKYVGNHQVNDYVEVEKKKVEELLKTGNYIECGNDNKPTKKINYKQWLIDLPKIEEKTADKIMDKYPLVENLKKATEKQLKDDLRDDVADIILKHRGEL